MKVEFSPSQEDDNYVFVIEYHPDEKRIRLMPKQKAAIKYGRKFLLSQIKEASTLIKKTHNDIKR